MGKTLYGKYYDAVRNTEVYLEISVARKVWVSAKIYLSSQTFHHLKHGGEGKYSHDWKVV